MDDSAKPRRATLNKIAMAMGLTAEQLNSILRPLSPVDFWRKYLSLHSHSIALPTFPFIKTVEVGRGHIPPGIID
jgi:hypothetical protein